MDACDSKIVNTLYIIRPHPQVNLAVSPSKINSALELIIIDSVVQFQVVAR